MIRFARDSACCKQDIWSCTGEIVQCHIKVASKSRNKTKFGLFHLSVTEPLSKQINPVRMLPAKDAPSYISTYGLSGWWCLDKVSSPGWHAWLEWKECPMHGNLWFRIFQFWNTIMKLFFRQLILQYDTFGSIMLSSNIWEKVKSCLYAWKLVQLVADISSFKSIKIFCKILHVPWVRHQIYWRGHPSHYVSLQAITCKNVLY